MVHNHRGDPSSFPRVFVSPRVATNHQAVQINLYAGLRPLPPPHPALPPPAFSPDDLSSVSSSCSKSLDIDWDSTGVSRDKINKESVAMNGILAHPNMKGRIIICQTPRRGHEFLRPLSYKMARPPAGSPDRAAGFPTLIFLRAAGWYFGLKSNLPHKLQLVIFSKWLIVRGRNHRWSAAACKEKRNEVQLEMLQVVNGSQGSAAAPQLCAVRAGACPPSP